MRRVLAAAIALAFAAGAGADDVEDGRRIAAEEGCLGCHGERGISADADTPNLAGQDHTYLMRQLDVLVDPEAAERLHGIEVDRYHGGMEDRLRDFGYRQRYAVATWLSSLACVPPEVPPTSSVPEVAKPCARCHGPFGLNLRPGVPDLTGQKRAYLARQLRAFRASRTGTAPGSPEGERYHPEMASEAARLGDAEIEAVADYFSGLACR